jgi:hypothetical protein
MKEIASGSNRSHALSKAPSWFIESCNRNLRSQNKEEITIKGLPNNHHSFSQTQRKYNEIKAAEMAKPQNAIERVKDQARRLAASKKRSKR